MSVHISAKEGEIAKIVLMPGDPLRAKHIAETMLEEIKLVSSTRNIYYYTGHYKGTKVTIGGSGMGCPSIGIYTYELYKEYDVECIIRIGTAGAYYDTTKVYDLVNVETAFSESTYARYAFGIESDHILHQGTAYSIINQEATKMNMKVTSGAIHSSDVFYRNDSGIPAIVSKNNCIAVEMEAFALFSNAQHFGKMAATIVTISDVIPTKESMSADERERSLEDMYRLALESSVAIDKLLS